MVALERGVHVLSQEFGFGYIERVTADGFLIQWDSGEFCTLTAQQIERQLEIVGRLPLSVIPLASSEVFHVDFRRRKLLRRELFIY